MSAALADVRPPGHTLPQRRFSWQARRTRSGWTLYFKLRLLRLIELTFLVNLPAAALVDGQTGVGFVRFYVDRSQEDPQGALGGHDDD